jgi:hypothetical protein
VKGPIEGRESSALASIYRFALAKSACSRFRLFPQPPVNGFSETEDVLRNAAGVDDIKKQLAGEAAFLAQRAAIPRHLLRSRNAFSTMKTFHDISETFHDIGGCIPVHLLLI